MARRAPPTGPLPLVTLSTDIGWSYAAQIKAVLLSAVPGLSVIDLAHDLPRHAVREGALLFAQMAQGFPAGTVHLAVVDPGVGGRRAAIAIATEDGSYLVGPDNGLLSVLADRLGIRTAVRLDPRRVVRGRRPSATFEGRDLFAPAAARLAQGIPLTALGSPHRPAKAPASIAQRRREGATGEVVHIDRFGNLITSLPGSWLPSGATAVHLTVPSALRPVPLVRVRTYEELPDGALGLLVSSFDLAEIAVREGSAAERLRLTPGDTFELSWTRAERRR